MPAATNPDEFTEGDWLALVGDERRQAIGFENDSELVEDREKALEYFKGEMDDMPSLPNRSRAVSTDLADAVETLMPDLMEVFTGEDVATFQPTGEEDVEAAEQETDYVNHILFNENRGWLTIYAKIKDALLCKIGVVKVYPETWSETSDEHFEGKRQIELQLASQAAQAMGAEIADVVATDPDPMTGEPLFNFTMRHTKDRGKVCVSAVPPEDFAVARDTIYIADATYCAMRSRMRAQQLVADGYDPQLVADLPAYTASNTNTDQVARDNAGENSAGVPITSSELFGLHQVEVIEHYIRVDADGDGKPELWCVVTGGHESILLKRYRVDRIPFAVSTPFIVTHRMFGQSLYDKLGEIQRIKTALVRLMLDSGYFAMNQRYEVNESAMGKTTLSDLLNNIPGAPILSKNGEAVRAVGGGKLDFDVTSALELASVMGEMRSGVVRNAQGLNPDTLHDTAKGAMALISAAQKRVRMIARIFAETGIKDIFLLIHATVRSLPSQDQIARLRGKWVPVDPTQWGERKDMAIEIGIGSGGRQQELAALQLVMAAQEKAVELQGGGEGPLVKMANLYKTAMRLTKLSGLKGGEQYFSDPEDPANQPQQTGEPKPDPAQQAAQAQVQIAQAKAQAKAQADQMTAQSDAQLALQRLSAEMGIKRQEMEQKIALQREQAAQELQLQREEMEATFQLKRQELMLRTSQSTDMDESVNALPGGVG